MALTNGLKKQAMAMKAAITAGNIEEAVDYATELDGIRKDLDKELKPIKNAIRKYADSNHLDEVEGNEHLAKLSGGKSSMIPPKDLYRVMKKEGVLDKFWDLIKVQVTDAKELMGELSLKDIIIEIPEAKRITFK